MGCVLTKGSPYTPNRGVEKLKFDNGFVKGSYGVKPPLKDAGKVFVVDGEIENGGSVNGKIISREGEDGVNGFGNVSQRISVKKISADEVIDGWPKWLFDNISSDVLACLVPKSVDSYDKLSKVGQGTYSNVYKARDRDTGKIVALKKVRFDTPEPESIKFMATSRMQYSLYLVFDFMQSDLTRVISRPEGKLTEPQVKYYMQQLLSGLNHCHERGILHRDIKGSNLLIDKNGMLKIADFGLANFYEIKQKKALTSRVVTLWYRAPELLLGSTDYGVGIDLWSVGCIFAEMLMGRPILPGRTEVEQLHRIFKLCGSPSEEYWKKTKAPATFRPPQHYKPSFEEAFTDFPPSSFLFYSFNFTSFSRSVFTWHRFFLSPISMNQIFKSKEKEFLERGDTLKKRMEILIELKTTLKQQLTKGAYSKEDVSISGTISCDEESLRDRTEELQGQENTTTEEQCEENEVKFSDDSPRLDETGKSMSRIKREDVQLRTLSGRYINCQGKNLRIHIPLTNPTRTFSYILWDDLIKQSSKKYNTAEGSKVHINKTKLHHAEKMIRGAFIELYKGLGYLKTYRNLNMLASVKILKKFDKVTNKQVLPIYLKVVESSYFNSSDKVIKLADEVEEIFINNSAEEDRRKAMKYLKPTQRKESHAVTFFIGLFTCCFVALFVGYAIMAHIAGMYRPRSDTIYMETVYPVLSMFSLLFLHFFLYGCNIFMWRKTRINYSFIFELSPRNELKYRDVFLICTMAMTAVVGVLYVHLTLMTKGYSDIQVQAIPGLLLLVFLLVLVCPFNIIYKSSRYRFLNVIRNIVLTPLYKVVMLDFFMADQLCSQVPMLRNLEYVACYYITGSYKTQDYGYCMRTNHYRDLAYAVSFLPYYWRAMQCARRWFDEGHKSHLVNLGKYVSAMLAAGAKVAYEKDRNVGWLSLLVVMSSAATVYQLYWDFAKDWGLLQMNSKNPWLRNELMLRRKWIYFFSMGLNLILRLAWLHIVLHYNFGSIDYRVTGLFLAALEVIRRGQWNFYRLENEHLNNAGKFRAVKTVPLPFQEVDDQD